MYQTLPTCYGKDCRANHVVQGVAKWLLHSARDSPLNFDLMYFRCNKANQKWVQSSVLSRRSNAVCDNHFAKPCIDRYKTECFIPGGLLQLLETTPQGIENAAVTKYSFRTCERKCCSKLSSVDRAKCTTNQTI